MINETPPLNRDYNRYPNIKALKRRGLINHESTLELLERRIFRTFRDEKLPRSPLVAV